MALVTIPFDYDPQRYNESLVPIFLNDTDDRGNKIHFGWIEAVVPIHSKLLALTRRILGDPWRVSEVTDLSVHHLSGKYGDALGPDPSRRVYRTARRKAYALDDPGARIHLGKNIALDTLTELQSSVFGAIGPSVEAQLDSRRRVELLESKLRELGTPVDFSVYRMLKSGYHWREIGDNVDENWNSVHRRFKRLLNRVRESI